MRPPNVNSFSFVQLKFLPGLPPGAARSVDLPVGQFANVGIRQCPAPIEKRFYFAANPNQIYKLRRPVPLQGRIAIVTDAGRDAVDAGGASDEGA